MNDVDILCRDLVRTTEKGGPNAHLTYRPLSVFVRGAQTLINPLVNCSRALGP